MTQGFLLDTNVLLALLLDPVRLPESLRTDIANPAHMVWFSAASLWEIAIKKSLGKAGFDFQPEDVHAMAVETRFTELPVIAAHAYAVARLPWHHRDPFDRLLVAQAMALSARLLTTDRMLSAYSLLVSYIP